MGAKQSVDGDEYDHPLTVQNTIHSLRLQLQHWKGTPPQDERSPDKKNARHQYVTRNQMVRCLTLQIEFWERETQELSNVPNENEYLMKDEASDKADDKEGKERNLVPMDEQVIDSPLLDELQSPIEEEKGEESDCLDGKAKQTPNEGDNGKTLKQEICGKQGVEELEFQKLSFPDVSLRRPESIDEMWSLVMKTSDAEGAVLKPTINRKGWKTVRVFVSSTFRDFYQEREVLVKEIFPELRVWCEERKLRLIECDLRWGVPRDTSSEETVKICMDELDRCREDNVEPFFLNLVGNRTGWIPEVKNISENVAAMYGWVFGLSVTEMEIVNGAFRRLNPNAIFMIREIDGFEKIQPTERENFVDIELECVEKLRILKSNIVERFPESSYTYQVSVEKIDDNVEFHGLHGENSLFQKKILSFLKNRIGEMYPLDPSSKNSFETQKDAHEAFMESRSQHIFGRDYLIKEIENYYTNDATRTPLVVAGKAGSGKSSVIAKCAKDAKTSADNDFLDVPDGFRRWNVFYHFVGATPGSTDLIIFLQRLRKQLSPHSKDMVSDLDVLLHQISMLLSNEASAPSIIFIDALNQFHEEKQYLLSQWLPEKLSPHVKVVLSVIEETPSHAVLRSYKPSPKEVVCGPLDKKAKKKIVHNNLELFNKKLDSDQMNLLTAKSGSNNALWLTLACEELRVHGTFENVNQKIEKLPDDLINLEMEVFTRFENENGGALVKATLCLLEVSRYGLLETELLILLADSKCVECPDFSREWGVMTSTLSQADEVLDSTSPAIENVELEKRFSNHDDAGFVAVTDAKDAILKSKMEDRKIKEINYLPARDWAVVHRNLKPFLRPCGDLGEGRLDFYHSSLNKATYLKYFAGAEVYTKQVYSYWRGILADYFVSVVDMDRKAEELPHQLQQLSDDKRLTQCLLEWPIFNRLYDEEFSTDLLQAWRMCGGYSIAAEMYSLSLKVLKQSEALDINYYDQAQKVARFLIQAGQYIEAYQILEECVSLAENNEDRLADNYQNMAYCKSEHLNITPTTDEAVRKTERKEVIDLCIKSNEYRKNLNGDDHEHKRAKNNRTLAYNLFKIKEKEEALKVIRDATAVFKKLNDIGLQARAMQTMAFLLPLEESLAAKIEAKELCLKVYGKNHELYQNICMNLGNGYKKKKQYQEAWDCYTESVQVAIRLFGPDHPNVHQASLKLQQDIFNDIRQMSERLTPGVA